MSIPVPTIMKRYVSTCSARSRQCRAGSHGESTSPAQAGSRAYIILLAMVPDLHHDRHDQRRRSRQDGGRKGDLTICDGHIGMDPAHRGADQKSQNSQEQADRERKQRQQERHQQHAQRDQEPSNQRGRDFSRRHDSRL